MLFFEFSLSNIFLFFRNEEFQAVFHFIFTSVGLLGVLGSQEILEHRHHSAERVLLLIFRIRLFGVVIFFESIPQKWDFPEVYIVSG